MFKGKATVVTGGAMGASTLRRLYASSLQLDPVACECSFRAGHMSNTGIGAATARRLIKEGASVVIADISAEAGTALVAELGSHAAFVSCDVRHAQAPIC